MLEDLDLEPVSTRKARPMPPTTNDELVRELADRAAILDVVTAYSLALDTKDWTTLGMLFTPDATWEYTAGGELLHGPDAVVARISATLRPLPTTQHLYGNHLVTVHGDEASHSCYVQAQHVGDDGEQFLGAGRYADRLRRTPAGWRFTHRELTSMWHTGNPSVLAT